MLELALAAEKRGERYIVCAALRKTETGRIMTGVRHYSPDMRANILASEGIEYWKSARESGFVDNFSIFHDREAAWKIAESRGQIRRVTGCAGTLFSEDLY